MTTKQMNDLVDRYLDSKGLSNPSIRKRAARKVLGYMDTTGAFLSGGQLALPSDKGVVVSAYKRHKGSALNGAEKSVINHIYELAGSSVGKSASRHAVTPKATKSVVTAPKAAKRTKEFIEKGGNADPVGDAIQDEDYHDLLDQNGGPERF